MDCIVVDDPMAPEGRLHVRNAKGLGGGSAITLCGWVDVEHKGVEGVPTCPQCLRIVAYCKSLRGVPKPERRWS